MYYPAINILYYSVCVCVYFQSIEVFLLYFMWWTKMELKGSVSPQLSVTKIYRLVFFTVVDLDSEQAQIKKLVILRPVPRLSATASNVYWKRSSQKRSLFPECRPRVFEVGLQ